MLQKEKYKMDFLIILIQLNGPLSLIFQTIENFSNFSPIIFAAGDLI
tara:strand:- start:133 stop:273 length:141 start_codon:yes stop_codon:yes gene_type:complete